LVNFQLSLEAEMRGQRFVDLSLADTISRLILLDQENRALEAKKRFNVSDTRYHWIKIRALSGARKFEELFLFSQKKSPIGHAV
jgi:vacuolar protein sorting-associated protein 16